MNTKVSILTPAHNCADYIAFTIESVLNQSYQDWEMLIVDDCSTDATRDVVRKYANMDERIRLFCQKKNAGAGPARNRALQEASGRYIAYLDADDLWYPEKLEEQIRFMNRNRCGFSCTSYEVIDAEGKLLNKEVHMLKSFDYTGFLTHNLLQTVGIMVDLSIVDRELLVMPDMKRRQDAATWLQILKADHCCMGMHKILAKYRRTPSSLSSRKTAAAKGVWYLYRKVEHLSLPFAMYCYIRYALLAVWKRMYFPVRPQKNMN